VPIQPFSTFQHLFTKVIKIEIIWGIYARFLIQNVRLFITHSSTNSNTAVAIPLVALLHHHAKLQKSALRNLYTVLVFDHEYIF
jgi:hypothetical protein